MMDHFSRAPLLGLALLSFIAVCTSNCTLHFDDSGLNAENEMHRRLSPDGWENCDSPMFLNINCTFEESLKPYLDGILNHSISNDMRGICSTDKFRLFITKPSVNASIKLLRKSVLEMNISIKQVYLDELGISEIMLDAFDSQETLEVIHLRKNKLLSISGNFFSKLTNLKELDLSDNKITKFNPGWSDSLRKVEILNISFNELTHLPSSTFNSMENLRELYLSGNSLYEVKTLLFKNMGNLTVIDLSGNMLDSFYFGTFDELQNLTTLNISYNKFEILPLYTFHAMKNLENLYFRNNKLSELDFNVFDLWKLKKVDFRGNSFPCIFLIGLINYLNEKNIQASTESDNVYKNESRAFNDRNYVYGFKCRNLYNIGDDEGISHITKIYASNYLSVAVKRISNTLDKTLMKLDEVLARLNHTDT